LPSTPDEAQLLRKCRSRFVALLALFFKIGEVMLVVLQGVLLEDFLEDALESLLIGVGLQLTRSSCCATGSG
jgi:hypothetical protein